jgi:DNA-binding NtrC family response regulator
MAKGNDRTLRSPAEPAGGWSPADRSAPKKPVGMLIVDDQAAVRHVLGRTLRQQGLALWLAAGGQEAAELYQQHQEKIAVVLLDVRMPGLDGPQTLALLQTINPRVHCWFMSGDLGEYTMEELLRMGAAAVLFKPLDLEQLGRLINQLPRDQVAGSTSL